MANNKTDAPRLAPLCWQDKNRPGVIRFKDAIDEMDGVLAGARAALIVRRVNQGPAFDAMVKAVDAIMKVRAKYGLVDPVEYRALGAALKLAQKAEAA